MREDAVEGAVWKSHGGGIHGHERRAIFHCETLALKLPAQRSIVSHCLAAHGFQRSDGAIVPEHFEILANRRILRYYIEVDPCDAVLPREEGHLDQLLPRSNN